MKPLELACLWRLSPPLEVPLDLLRRAGLAAPEDVPRLLEEAANALLSRAKALRSLERQRLAGQGPAA